MARVVIKSNSTEPLGGPNLGLGTDQGDSWNTTVANLNAMTGDSYAALNANFRNMLDGADFLTNPFQRGTSISGIAATATYVADRWFLAGSVSGVSAIGAQTAFSSIPSFSQALAFGRVANASSLGVVTLGQVMETSDSIRCQGQTLCLSFYASTGANYSGGNLGVQLSFGTGTDLSAQSSLAGTWTGQNNVVSATQALTSTMTRYAFSGICPTSATQLAVQLSYTPTGSAGANDNVLLMGPQLEMNSGPGPFEHRDVEVELALCQRYCYVIKEPTTAVVVGAGMATASNRLQAVMSLPTQMRAAPSVTVTAGSFVFRVSGADLTATSFAAGTTHTANYISVSATGTVASNAATFLQGGAGTGSITASADY